MKGLELVKHPSLTGEQAHQPQRTWHPLAALPDDMVAYCRAALDAYRAGERFVLHWHQPGDGIAYAPQGPHRAVVLPASGVSGAP